jgi:hypothetical protein
MFLPFFKPVTFSFDIYRGTMVQNSVQHSCGDNLIMAIFEQTPGKVKQDKDFSQESKHKERSIASSNEFLTISWQYVNLLSQFEFHSSKA